MISTPDSSAPDSSTPDKHPGGRIGGMQEEAGLAGQALDTVKQKAANAAEQAKQAAAAHADTAKTRLARGAERQRLKAADGVGRVAGATREMADRLRDEDQAAAAGWVAQAADAIDTSGRYLREHDLAEIGRRGAALARRHPVAAVTGGLVAGLALSRVTKAWYDGVREHAGGAADGPVVSSSAAGSLTDGHGAPGVPEPLSHVAARATAEPQGADAVRAARDAAEHMRMEERGVTA